MDAKVLRLEEVRRGDVAVAGGKGANLGDLSGKGFPVPPGFVVSAQACQDFFQTIGLEKEFGVLTDAAPVDLEKHCATIRAVIGKADLPQDLTGAIMAAHLELVKNRDTKEPITPWNAKPAEMGLTNQISAKLKELGLFTFVRWNWIFTAPPLVVTKEQIDEGLSIISQAISIADEAVS